MKSWITTFAVMLALILAAVPASSSPASVCLSISASDEYEVLTSDPWTGDRTLYVWTRPCIVWSGGSEFEFVGTLEVVDLVPRAGIVNEGTVSSPILLYPTCITEETLVAEITVRDVSGSGGTVCFGAFEDGFVSCGYDCVSASCGETYTLGFSTVGQDPCPLAVSTTKFTWRALKAVFR